MLTSHNVYMQTYMRTRIHPYCTSSHAYMHACMLASLFLPLSSCLSELLRCHACAPRGLRRAPPQGAARGPPLHPGVAGGGEPPSRGRHRAQELRPPDRSDAPSRFRGTQVGSLRAPLPTRLGSRECAPGLPRSLAGVKDASGVQEILLGQGPEVAAECAAFRRSAGRTGTPLKGPSFAMTQHDADPMMNVRARTRSIKRCAVSCSFYRHRA